MYIYSLTVYIMYTHSVHICIHIYIYIYTIIYTYTYRPFPVTVGSRRVLEKEREKSRKQLFFFHGSRGDLTHKS